MFNFKTLYDQLFALTKFEKTPFYFLDEQIMNNGKCVDNYFYRIFNYSLAKPNHFKMDGALFSRGTMFLMKDDGTNVYPEELVVFGMEKFHTFGEGEFTKDLDMKDAVACFLKLDGSLVDTYLDLSGNLSFKTKKKAYNKELNNMIQESIQDDFFDELYDLTQSFTVSCEFTSPNNRVVIPYTESKLYVLKARNRKTGEMLDLYTDEFAKQYPKITKHLAPKLDLSILKDITYNNNLLNIPKIEGVVVLFADGSMTKVKTQSYLAQFRFSKIQDFKQYDKLLSRAVIFEEADNLRTLFHYRNQSDNFKIDEILSRIDSVEKQIQDLFPPFKNKVLGFYNENKHLSKQDFVQKTKETDLIKYMSFYAQLLDGQNPLIEDLFLNTVGRSIRSK